MLTLIGYQMTKLLHESANSYIYRAICEKNNQQVVLKILKQEYPSPEKIAWFKREYETTQSLHDINGVISVYGLENDKNRVLFWKILVDNPLTV